jgi:hypothetical protein
MFDIGRKVVIITDNAITFEGTVIARAKGDNGPGAYKIALKDSDPDVPGEWHKASNVFIAEQTAEEMRESWDGFITGTNG